MPPGRYDVKVPQKNEYWRIGDFKRATLRTTQSAGTQEPLKELELVFKDKRTGEENRLVVGGLNIAALPQLDTMDYSKGLYMPMGIGVPPFYQSYDELQQHPPDLNPYFSVLLDAKGRWINHHNLALDGFCAHRDKANANVLHLYLLSYERMTLIVHFVVTL